MSTEDTNPAETAQDGGIPTFTVDEVFGDPRTRPAYPGVARELAALGQIIDLLEAIPTDARDRSMRYLADRYRQALTHPLGGA